MAEGRRDGSRAGANTRQAREEALTQPPSDLLETANLADPLNSGFWCLDL